MCICIHISLYVLHTHTYIYIYMHTHIDTDIFCKKLLVFMSKYALKDRYISLRFYTYWARIAFVYM